MRCYHVRTNPGLEALLSAELARRRPDAVLAVRPQSRVGWVSVELPDTAAAPDWAALRVAYEAVEVTAVHDLLTPGTPVPADGAAWLARIVAAAEGGALPEIPTGATLAVRCRREGSHPFSSPEVERAVGAVVVGATAARVNLSSPDVTVRADLSEALLVIGRLAWEEAGRFRWLYRPRVTLSPVVAAACLRLAVAADPQHPDGRSARALTGLLDPFCGSGTIPLEAADQLARDPALLPGEASLIRGCDTSGEAVAGAGANAEANGLQERVEFLQADARRPAPLPPEARISHIVCNPPFGVRMGRRMEFGRFYREVLDAAATVTRPGSRMVLLSSRRRARLNQAIQASPAWRIAGVHLIEIGGVYPGIFVLDRLD